MLTEEEKNMLMDWYGEDMGQEFIDNYPELEKELRSKLEKTVSDHSQNLSGNVFYRLGVKGDINKIMDEFKAQGVKICMSDDEAAKNADCWCVNKFFDHKHVKNWVDTTSDLNEEERFIADMALISNDTPPYELRSPLLSKENAAYEINSAVKIIHGADGRVKGTPLPVYPEQLAPLLTGSREEYDNRIQKALDNMDEDFKKEFNEVCSKAAKFDDMALEEGMSTLDDDFVYRGSVIYDNPYGVVSNYPNRAVSYAAFSIRGTEEYAQCIPAGEIDRQQPLKGIIYKYAAAKDQPVFHSTEIEGGNELTGMGYDEELDETIITKEKNPCVGKFVVLQDGRATPIPDTPKWEQFLSSIKTQDTFDGKTFPYHHNAAMKNEQTHDLFTRAQSQSKTADKTMEASHYQDNRIVRMQSLRGLPVENKAPYKTQSQSSINYDPSMMRKAGIKGR